MNRIPEYRVGLNSKSGLKSWNELEKSVKCDSMKLE